MEMEIVWLWVIAGGTDVVVTVEVDVIEMEMVWLWVIGGGMDVVVMVAKGRSGTLMSLIVTLFLQVTTP